VAEPERLCSWKAMVGYEWEAGAEGVESKDQIAGGRSRVMSESVESEPVVVTSCCWWRASMLTLC
jgi:hypothetical protein